MKLFPLIDLEACVTRLSRKSNRIWVAQHCYTSHRMDLCIAAPDCLMPNIDLTVQECDATTAA